MLGPKLAGLQMRPATRPTGSLLSRRRSTDLLHQPEHVSIERARMFPSAMGNQATLRRLAQRSENSARVNGHLPERRVGSVRSVRRHPAKARRRFGG